MTGRRATRPPKAASRDDRPPTENRLLDALPRAEYERIRPHLEGVPIAARQVISEADGPISHVYFPTGGVISLVSFMDRGAAVEIATIGREGLVGLPVFLGAASMPQRAFGQVPGFAYRMEAGAFRAEVARNDALVPLLNRYTQAMFVQVAQTAACNRVHPVETRCARWLLQTHDRVGEDAYTLTQEFLAQMLGVQRPSVNAAARTLQQAGLIRYVRGRITIVDREGLESASCACYGIIQREFDRLLGHQ
jgi:CRP-like cAMP-binding protein